MTDIVERLRRDATCTSHHEAAAEIEELREVCAIAVAASNRANDRAAALQMHVYHLEAERDRAVEARDFAIKEMVDMARRDALEEAANLAGQIAASRFATSKTCQSDRSRKHMHIRADEAGQIAAAIRALKEKGDD